MITRRAALGGLAGAWWQLLTARVSQIVQPGAENPGVLPPRLSHLEPTTLAEIESTAVREGRRFGGFYEPLIAEFSTTTEFVRVFEDLAWHASHPPEIRHIRHIRHPEGA